MSRWKYDDYQSDTGRSEGGGGVEASWAASDRLTTPSVSSIWNASRHQNGDRTDAAVRVTVESDKLKYYVWPDDRRTSACFATTGLVLAPSPSLAVAGRLKASQRLQRLGRKLLFSRSYGQGESTYFGYEQDPDRDPYGNGLTGLDGGKYTFGARRKLTDTLASWGENTYDLFGEARSPVPRPMVSNILPRRPDLYARL